MSSTDSLQIKQKQTETERLEKRKKIEEQEKIDSLRFDKALQEALKIAYQNIDKDIFSTKTEIISDSISVEIDINSGYYFTKYFPHLVIRRKDLNNLYIDIYSKNKNNFDKVLSHQEWLMTYVNDTIRDINGDGLNDFVLNWYGSCGCCLKAFSDIYLLRENKKEFSEKFEFINPTFAPKEKIIRGVCYGHPGETEIYKYK